MVAIKRAEQIFPSIGILPYGFVAIGQAEALEERGSTFREALGLGLGRGEVLLSEIKNLLNGHGASFELRMCWKLAITGPRSGRVQETEWTEWRSMSRTGNVRLSFWGSKPKRAIWLSSRQA